MKKRILALVGMAALLASGSNAYAATGHATATIAGALTVSQDADGVNGGVLTFGHIIPDAETPGTVTVAASGTNDSFAVTVTTQITQSPAQFAVSGDSGTGYSVTLPGAATLHKTGALVITDMAVTNFTSNLIDNKGTLSDPAGQGTFKVGAKLAVAAAQPSGVYNGTFDVTVLYQ
ncbi:DUF4402 domain-containing protein [Pelodictyon phaeoclathratiforme]|jgi:acyl CoA:acetate/3-ketoacid CoA transferase beta subunit|uniref:YapH protein n=1 Tax=Pelodictyon phaeoclathratiforme (strain DSM 5477 / BU-1) TaxID=324925 RepID=B4SH86_PELPB|nr:DUF4402 domain-containing protein [Pelodictyon phaeoclathratiforme]ACF43553.1 YapH protein [Pelodictyon phaeoclathratiforme BU-1]MBV5289147.1 DUF4402 domain-containing protein [Pelodictyon phaeoclathratiforme]